MEFSEIRSAADMALYLEGMEADFGPFDARLGQPMLRAGDLLAESGDYLQARNFLERALHVMRINEGLYSEPQIAIVERLIDCNTAIEDWDAVDDNFRYLQFLYTRLYEKGTEQWNYGIAQVSDWHIIAINNNLGSDTLDHLREANKLFRERLALAEKAGNVEPHVMEVLQHNVDTTAFHLRKSKQEEEGGLYTERVYSRLEPRYRDSGSVASLD